MSLIQGLFNQSCYQIFQAFYLLICLSFISFMISFIFVLKFYHFLIKFLVGNQDLQLPFLVIQLYEILFFI